MKSRIILTLLVLSINLLISCSDNVESDNEEDGLNNLVEQIDEVLKSEKPRVEILQSNPSIDELGNVIVYVKIKNISDKKITLIGINSIFYDADGNIVGDGAGVASDINPGATKTVKTMSMSVKEADTYEVEISSII